MRKSFSVVILLLIFSVSGGQSLLAQELRENSQQEQPPSAVESALRTAGSQYEIIDVLLAEGRFDEVAREFAVIVELGLQETHEVLITQAAWDFAVALREAGEYEVAHDIIDQALAVSKGAESRYSLLMQRGKIFKDQGRYGEAIRSLREAQKLGIPLQPEPSDQRTRSPQ